MISVVKIV